MIQCGRVAKGRRYVKQLDSSQPPWISGSDFNALSNACAEWRASLPPNLQFNPATIYVRIETGELGALCLLHGTYNQTMLDLYRIFVPALYKLPSTFDFPDDQQEYLLERQGELYGHARSIATLAIEAMNRQGPTALADFWWPTMMYDSSRHMVYYATQVQQGNGDILLDTTNLLRSNIEALKMMRPLCAMAEPLVNSVVLGLWHSPDHSQYIATDKMLSRLHVMGNDSSSIGSDNPVEFDDTCRCVHRLLGVSSFTNSFARSDTSPGTPTQTSPDYVLHPLSIYRMTRKSIPKDHVGETTTSSPAPVQRPNPSITAPRDGSHTPSSHKDLASGGASATATLSLLPESENLPSQVSWIDGESQLSYPSLMTTLSEPAAAGVGGLSTNEIPPWIADFQLDQSWLDFWPGPSA